MSSSEVEVNNSLPAQAEVYARVLPAMVENVRPRQRYWLSALLLLLTIASTLMVGAQLQNNFASGLPLFSLDENLFPLNWILQHPARLLLGIPFAFTLMAILLAHELGHYIACRRYGVDASLPYFIPAPTVIGTMGAFIRIRSRIPSRAALFDIGVAGPIAGFVLALPALIVGMRFSHVAPTVARASDLQLGYPLIFHLFGGLARTSGFAPAVSLQDICLHPVAIAAWVGMFATALNLLPGGQLDGGHILYAIWPRAHKRASFTLLGALLLITPFLWLGWLVWAAVLISFGRHPYVPAGQPLGTTRYLLAATALLIFLLSFTPVPFPGAALSWQHTLINVRSALHWIGALR